VERRTDLDGHEVGKSKKERAYRLWCLNNTLFLNPLNDIGPHRIAAQDILHLPPFVMSLGEPPALFGLFNQLKQEFVTARWPGEAGRPPRWIIPRPGGAGAQTPAWVPSRT